MITNVDENVGKLMHALENEGIKENTIVLFLVDNGPNSQRIAGRFRGNKTNVHEGGVRSPLIVHWPNRLNASNRFDGVAAHIDLAPTILAACQVQPPKDHPFDGRSFLAALEGTDATWPERDLVIQTHRGNAPVLYHHFMIRRGNWKLLNASGFGREDLPGSPQFELYNLAADPGETKNLASEQPTVLAQLKAGYEAWFRDVGSTRPDNYAQPAIHIGTPYENLTRLTNQDLRQESGSSPGWKLRCREAHPSSLTIVAPSGFEATRAMVRVDEREKSYEIRLTNRKATISGVSFPKGEYGFFVELENAAGQTKTRSSGDS